MTECALEREEPFRQISSDFLLGIGRLGPVTVECRSLPRQVQSKLCAHGRSKNPHGVTTLRGFSFTEGPEGLAYQN